MKKNCAKCFWRNIILRVLNLHTWQYDWTLGYFLIRSGRPRTGNDHQKWSHLHTNKKKLFSSNNNYHKYYYYLTRKKKSTTQAHNCLLQYNYDSRIAGALKIKEKEITHEIDWKWLNCMGVYGLTTSIETYTILLISHKHRTN